MAQLVRALAGSDRRLVPYLVSRVQSQDRFDLHFLLALFDTCDNVIKAAYT